MFKKIIFYLIIVIISFPLIDTLFNGIVSTTPLKGDYSKTNDIKLSTESFFNSDYQNQKSKFLNEDLNLYPFFVKLRNQYLYSIFNETKAFHTVIGKDNYMFDITYISAYYGNDFLGEQKIKSKVQDIKMLKQILEYYGKNVMVCFLPGKASFYPEKIPDKYSQTKFNPTNIDYFTKELIDNKIVTLNLKQYFLNAKDTSKYSLYPKYGIHLSSYATILTADTIIKFIEDTFNVDIPNPIITNIEVTNKLKYYDPDIYETLNLLESLNMDTMAYPTLNYSKGKDKLKVLTIGDSFYKYIFDYGIHTNCFDNGNFWFYSKRVWPLSTNINVKNLNIRNEIANNNLIILYATEATLYGFPFDATDIINEKILPLDKEWINNFYLNKINNSPDWINAIREKAINNNIDFDLQKQKDITYLTNEYVNKLDQKNKDLYLIIEKIKSDKNWLNQIKQKAINNNTNLNNMIYLDAMYILNQEKK